MPKNAFSFQGAVHYAQGDRDKGEDSVKKASRTTVVVASAGIGYAIGGPKGVFHAVKKAVEIAGNLPNLIYFFLIFNQLLLKRHGDCQDRRYSE